MHAADRNAHYFADIARGRAAAITVVEEHGTPVIFDVVLDVDDGRITAIETLVIRDPNGARRYEERGEPHAKFTETVPPADRLPREALVAVADSYLSGMQNNDPNGDYGFFHEQCDRWEHAEQTTNQDPEEYGHSTDTEFVTLGCREQFETGFLGFVTRIRDRRYVVVDEARQSVFGLAFLDHAGTIRSIPLAGGSTFEVPPYFSTPRTLEVGEAWRIEDGKLRQIEMTLTEFPYGLRPARGASSAPPALAEPRAPPPPEAFAAEPFAADCDGGCLRGVAERFRAALRANEPGSLPLTRDVVYRENGQRLAPGDGLWGTLTEWGEPALVAADASTRTVAVVAPHVETDVRGLVLAGLTLAPDGRVAEIEIVVAREKTAGERGGTLTLFAPRIAPAFEADRFAVLDALAATAAPATSAAETASRYAAALRSRDAANAPLADTCTHRINGAPPAAGRSACANVLEDGLFSDAEDVRERRLWVRRRRGRARRRRHAARCIAGRRRCIYGAVLDPVGAGSGTRRRACAACRVGRVPRAERHEPRTVGRARSRPPNPVGSAGMGVAACVQAGSGQTKSGRSAS